MQQVQELQREWAMGHVPEEKGRKKTENQGRRRVGNGSTPYLTLEGLEELMKVPLTVREAMK